MKDTSFMPREWKKKWFCGTMGWHIKPKTVSSDGFQSSGNCPRCGVHVLLDSQGNWFGTTIGKEEGP